MSARRQEEEAQRWEQGARGERAVAALLEGLDDRCVIAHDLPVPQSRANFDHVVIAPSGAFLIDAKHWSGDLHVGDGMVWRGRFPIRRELETVRWEAWRLQAVLGVPVTPIICFPSAPLEPAVLVVGDVTVATGAQLVDIISGRGALLDATRIARLGAALAALGPIHRLPAVPAPPPLAPASTAAASTSPTSAAGDNGPARLRRARPRWRLLVAIASMGSAAAITTIVVASAVLPAPSARATPPTAPVTAAAPLTTSTADEPTSANAPAPFGGSYRCPGPGRGWELTVRFATTTPWHIWWQRPSADTWIAAGSADASSPIGLGGFAPRQAVRVKVAPIGADGADGPPTTMLITAPDSPC